MFHVPRITLCIFLLSGILLSANNVGGMLNGVQSQIRVTILPVPNYFFAPIDEGGNQLYNGRFGGSLFYPPFLPRNRMERQTPSSELMTAVAVASTAVVVASVASMIQTTTTTTTTTSGTTTTTTTVQPTVPGSVTCGAIVCLNGGSCQSVGSVQSCVCTIGWMGQTCNQPNP